jgi:DHA1 family bicyclomycin/chloramphenicol resistance-like MFS transporter
MGSMQFACGLLGGVILNFLAWTDLLNMATLMFCFISIAMLAIFNLSAAQVAQQP